MVIGFKLSEIEIKDKELLDRVEKRAFSPIRRAALLVERSAKTSMAKGGREAITKVNKKTGKTTKTKRFRRVPSKAPNPPHVQTGNLRGSITHAIVRIRRFLSGGITAIVGPTRLAWYGQIHEYGGEFGGRHYPARPFMRPALARTQDQFQDLFKGFFS